ncbi:MAG TPA: hypothetical protein VFU05_01370, partial [Cyclobacteriaceae bacterium]|nr:hypothetical protein [Cyclobacteriaceae bacterium]
NPLVIEDVWKLTGESSLIPTEKLEIRLNNLSLPEYSLKVAVPGALAWKDGIRDSEVVWMPASEGNWHISKHPHQVSKLLNRPDITANCVDRNGYVKRPGLIDVFAGGCDPYDTKSDGEAKDLSLGGISVRLKFFPQVDGQKFEFDEAVQDFVPSNGGESWETDQYVCDYVHRHDNPEDFYEDLIKTCVYYGCYILTERQKQAALVTYFTHRGYLGYLMERPQETSPINRIDHQYGMPSTPETIAMYDGLMMAEAVRKANTINHPRILMQAIQVTSQTRTKMDLYVACGFSQVACKSIVVKTTEEEKLAGGLFFEERVV